MMISMVIKNKLLVILMNDYSYQIMRRLCETLVVQSSTKIAIMLTLHITAHLCHSTLIQCSLHFSNVVHSTAMTIKTFIVL